MRRQTWFKWKTLEDAGDNGFTEIMRLPNGYLFRTTQFGQQGAWSANYGEHPRTLTSAMTFVPSDEEWEDL